MKSYIINLPQSADRRVAILSWISSGKCLDAEFIDAVDGRIMSEAERHKAFDHTLFRSLYFRNPRPGEIGCTLSHRKAYQQIATDGKPAVILEDDISPSRQFANDIAETEKWLNSEEPRLLLLGSECMYRGKSDATPADSFHSRIAKPYIYASGSFSYAINPAAAKAILSLPAGNVADDFIYFSKKTGIKLRLLLPPLFTPATEDELPSTIANASMQKITYTIPQRLLFKLRHIRNQFLLRTGILHFQKSIPPRPL